MDPRNLLHQKYFPYAALSSGTSFFSFTCMIWLSPNMYAVHNAEFKGCLSGITAVGMSARNSYIDINIFIALT